MKIKLGNNSLIKLLSVVIAIIIWLFVSNVNDPIKNESYQVEVDVINDDYIYEMDKTYQIKDENRKATVYLNGKSSVVKNRFDIVVEADMTQIVDMGTDPVYVPLRVKTLRNIAQENITIIPKTIPVSIENVETKEFMITVNTKGTAGKGYEVGECIASPEKITIRGPESTIKKIKSVSASVNVAGLTADATKKASISIIDQNGEALSESAMEYLQIYGLNEEKTVDVAVKIWEVLDDVSIVPEYTGSPAYGYQVDTQLTTPETISVAGTEEALEKIKKNGNMIVIPAEMVDISGATSDQEIIVKLSAILKEEDGYKIPADEVQTISVKVNILPYGSKEIRIGTEQIQVSGLDTKYRMTYDTDSITVRVKAGEANLYELSAKQIQCSIDLTGKTEGEYTVPVSVALPQGYELVKDISVTLKLVETSK